MRSSRISRPWLAGDDRTLLELCAQGLRDEVIAQKMARTDHAIGRRLFVLRRQGVEIPQREGRTKKAVPGMALSIEGPFIGGDVGAKLRRLPFLTRTVIVGGERQERAFSEVSVMLGGRAVKVLADRVTGQLYRAGACLSSSHLRMV